VIVYKKYFVFRDLIPYKEMEFYDTKQLSFLYCPPDELKITRNIVGGILKQDWKNHRIGSVLWIDVQNHVFWVSEVGDADI